MSQRSSRPGAGEGGERSPFVRCVNPVIPEISAWSGYLSVSYETGWFANRGPCARRFEIALTERYARETEAAVAVGNATIGLTACLVALGCSGRVGLPSFTFPATFSAVRMAGCEPVVLDVDAATAQKVMGLVDALEDCDDVQNVFTNMDLSPEVVNALDALDE